MKKLGERRNKIDLEKERDDIVEFGLQLFDLFSNLDALRLFLYAYDGLESSKKAMKELGLTPKRYYSRLRELVEIGVLEKSGGKYQYTPLGKAIYQLGYYLLDVLRNKEKLKLIGELMETSLLETDEMNRVLGILSRESEGLELILKAIIGDEKIGIVEKIIDYDELSNKLAEDIESAQHSVYLASRYLDARVSEACIKALRRNIRLRVLLSKETFDKLNMLKLFLSPKSLKIMMEIFSSGDITIEEIVKESEFPYSFCIIDDRICYFEFPSIIKGSFSIAFKVLDERVAKRFSNLFDDLWEKSNKRNIFSFLRNER